MLKLFNLFLFTLLPCLFISCNEIEPKPDNSNSAIGQKQDSTSKAESINKKPTYKCPTVGYKTFQDTTFKVNDKIICPEIIWNQPGGSRFYKDQSAKAIDSIAVFLQKNTHLKFELSCHTDTRGNDQMNQKTTDKRAEVIKNYLFDNHNIDTTQVVFKGYGESSPLIPTDTILAEKDFENQQLMYICNIRTELQILGRQSN